jgi:hypothetical protein
VDINEKFGELANDESIENTIVSLGANGIDAQIADSGKEATRKVFELILKGAEVMTMTSQTLEVLGIAKEINESGNYNSIRTKLAAMDRATQGREMQKLGAAPDWTIGSVHAVTENGEVLIASNTGSQLPAYAFGADHVVWVVGAQKIVANVEEGHKRIREYTYFLEDARAQKAYGMHTAINKTLIVSKENVAGRITMIIVKEKLGF